MLSASPRRGLSSPPPAGTRGSKAKKDQRLSSNRLLQTERLPHEIEKKILPLNTCVYLYPSCFLHGVPHSDPRAPSVTYCETHYAIECERVWKVRPRKVRRLVPHHSKLGAS